MCASAKSCSLTLYEFFNRQDLSAIETERNAVFYSKHTRLSPFQRFSGLDKDFCNTLRNSHKRHKKTACNRQHFCKQRICIGGDGGSWTRVPGRCESDVYVLVLPIGFSSCAAPANGLAQERSAVKSRGIAQMLNSSARTLPAPLSLSVRQGNDVAD